jgi:hypothetical protein
MVSLVSAVVVAGCRSREEALERADNPCAVRYIRSRGECENAFVNSINVENLKLGQTTDEVRVAMGKAAERRELTADSESWIYHTDYRNRLWTAIIFKQGRVAEIREVDMRRRR